MKIFSSSLTKMLDCYTIEHEPVSSIDLMERASYVFAEAFKKIFPPTCKLVVLAGHGNNGGDALAVARLLSADDYKIEVYLYNFTENLSSDCEINKQRLLKIPTVKFKECNSSLVLPELPDECVVIDGLFGSGLNRPLEGGYLPLVEHINRSSAQVVSIDIPSGLFGEDNTQNNSQAIICSDVTFTFQYPKLSFLLPENELFVPRWEVLDIGLHPDILKQTETSYYLTEKKDIIHFLKSRSKFAHKGNFGHALLISGSYGKMGAAVLAAKACLRTGVGLITVHMPRKGVEVMQTSLPEAMVSIDEGDFCFSRVPDIQRFDFVGVGPGIGTGDKTISAFERLLSLNDKPLVLDADALNILSKKRAMFRLIPENSILTPHPKEFDRIAGSSVSSYERMHKAMKMAVELKSYIVLKGAYTAVCMPDNTCWFNPTGNPGMASAGCGDVLTGMILSLLSQGYTSREAALLGVYLHGMTGDLAVESGNYSYESLLAGDTVEMIGKCYNLLRN